MHFFVIYTNENLVLNIASGTIELLSLVSIYCTQRETKLQDIMYRNMSLNLNSSWNILCVQINLKYEKNKIYTLHCVKLKTNIKVNKIIKYITFYNVYLTVRCSTSFQLLYLMQPLMLCNHSFYVTIISNVTNTIKYP